MHQMNVVLMYMWRSWCNVQVIRNKVILFAQQSVKKSIPYPFILSLIDSGYPSPPYKIIIMDEADSLTMDAQSALRRVMEMYSKVTRFCFICNYISKIIPALSSRCARFEFGALPRDNVVARLRYISDEEKMNVDDDVEIRCIDDEQALQYIYDQSKGDLRSGIHLLQNSFMIFQKDAITKEKLHSITMEIPPMIVKNLWDTIVATTTASSIMRLSAAVEKVILDGYPLSILLSLLTSYVVNNTGGIRIS